MGRPRVGTAFPHGDHFDIRITLPDGTRSNPACQPPEMTEAEARAKAKRLTELAAKEGYVRTDAPKKGPAATIGGLVEKWVPLIDASSLAPATRKAHASHAKGPISDRFGSFKPELLTTGALRAWLRDLKKTLSASRTRNIFFSLSRMLDDAAAENWIDLPNPCRHPKVREELPALEEPDDEDKAHHTEVEASKLIRATKAPDRRLRYLVAFTSGMRDGEIAGLRWSDLTGDERPAAFHIRGALALHGDDGHATRRAPKTKSSKRVVPVHPLAAAELKRWRSHGWKALVGREPRDEDPVFPSPSGDAWRPHSAEFFREDLEAAGLSKTFNDEPFEFRSTRRSFATWLEKNQVSGELIDRLLGHSAQSVRRRHYSAADLEALARAVATITLTTSSSTAGPAGGRGGVPSEVSSERARKKGRRTRASVRNYWGAPDKTRTCGLRFRNSVAALDANESPEEHGPDGQHDPWLLPDSARVPSAHDETPRRFVLRVLGALRQRVLDAGDLGLAQLLLAFETSLLDVGGEPAAEVVDLASRRRERR